MTIKDIARLSGYAVGTVSRVLNGSPNVSDEARAKVMAVVQEHHFTLNNNAKHLKQQAGSGIAIIVKGTRNMLFAPLVEQMQGLIRKRDLASLIYYIDEDENELDQALQVCRERHPQGILFLGGNLEDFRARFSQITVPCVLVTTSAVSLGFDNLSSVSTADAAAAEFAVDRLIGMGHRRIGVLGGRADSHTAAVRYGGCRASFKKHGMEFDPAVQYVPARFGMEDGYRAMGDLLDRMPGLTAVFAMSDVMAVGAIRAIHERGLRVPQDVSVMGFDGIELGRYLTPQLTTIQQHRESIADRSVEILLRCIEEKAPAVHEMTPFGMIAGESVRAL